MLGGRDGCIIRLAGCTLSVCSFLPFLQTRVATATILLTARSVPRSNTEPALSRYRHNHAYAECKLRNTPCCTRGAVRAGYKDPAKTFRLRETEGICTRLRWPPTRSQAYESLAAISSCSHALRERPCPRCCKNWTASAWKCTSAMQMQSTAIFANIHGLAINRSLLLIRLLAAALIVSYKDVSIPPAQTLQVLTHAAGIECPLERRMGSAGNLARRTFGCCRRTVARHRRIALVRTDLEPARRRVGSQWVAAEVRRPSVAASCVGIDQAALATVTCPVRIERPPGVGVPLRPCVDSLLPSSWLSTLCGFL